MPLACSRVRRHPELVKENGIVWNPRPDFLESTNVGRFMRASGISGYGDLIRRSTADIEWFWDACLRDLGIEWFQPYTAVLDQSRGFPWSRWFAGGRLNLAHNCLDRHARRTPGKVCLIWEGDDGSTRELSYGELDELASSTAAALVAAGVGRGDRVGFYMPMLPELVAAFMAVLKVGASAVPVFSAFGPSALSTRLADAGVKLLFTADGCYRRGQAVPVQPAADEALGQVSSVATCVIVRRTGGPVRWKQGRDVWWEDFVAGQPAHFGAVDVDSEHECLIIYTSGTTGKPKGSVHTHGGLAAQASKELAYYFDVHPGDRFFWLTDIGWMMGAWEILGVTALGASVVIFEGAVNWPDPGRLWRIVERHRLTHLGVSPTAVRMLLRSGEDWVRTHDVSSLRILGSTGEAWDPESYMWLFRNAGGGRCPIINISGGTEVMGSLVACSPAAPLKSCSFQGPGLGMDVDVVDDAGHPVRGERGYLVIRKPAPSMTRGFLNDPGRYLETYFSRWPGTWYHGDWARIDQDHFWFIEGRADDTIKVAGKRTGPAEVESALMTHEAVSEAAAIGVPDEIKGEEIVCFVVLQPGIAPTGDLAFEIEAAVVRALGKTMRPKRIEFTTALPKTRSAKIVRGAIRRRYLGLPQADVSSIENLEALESIPEMIRPDV
jgi:acetyl-CoA synthetase